MRKFPIRVVPPIGLDAVMLPVPAVRVKSYAPSKVLEKVMLPMPAPEFKINGPVIVIGPAKVMG